MRRNKKKLETIIEGVSINESTYSTEENRIFTLLVKGFITYLICAGVIGSAITSTQTQMNHLALNLCCLLFSFIISFIYYNKLTENIGDILYFLVVSFIGVYYSTYINSGFYSWMNDLLGTAGAYFKIDEIGGYNAKITNSYLAVTIASCYLSSIAVILIYIIVVKKIHFIDIILDCGFILFLPLYLELEPNLAYLSMAICGIIFSYVLNCCGNIKKTENNKAYRNTKTGIEYVYNVKAILQTFILIIPIIVITSAGIYLLFPKDEYIQVRQRSNAKSYSDDFVSNIMTAGIGAFFNKYDNTGGLSTGRLGGVNSVSLDYQPDLYVTYAPYNYNPVYLRNFVAGEYVPYSDIWVMANRDYVKEDEYTYLKNRFNDNSYSGKGVMNIENVDAYSTSYSPYYSSKNTGIIAKGNSLDINFYTRLDNSLYDAGMKSLSKEEYEYWTLVPQENQESIKRFVEKVGIEKGMNELEKAMAIKTYFEDNIPYTLRPGATPRKKDFVNYFLDNNKKGYCAHFASAGTLALRYLGVPARYVEGYCFDYDNMLEASIVNADYDKYYKGYNELSDKGVIKVEVSDADAHAWIEIFINGYGWTSIELTPPSSDSQIGTGNLFSKLLEMLSTSDKDINSESNYNNKTIDTKRLRIFLGSIVVIAISSLILYRLILLTAGLIIYKNASINDKLIIIYHRYLKNKSKKYPISDTVNYKEQINLLRPEAQDNMTLIKILEKAGFSNELISDEEFKYVIERLK